MNQERQGFSAPFRFSTFKFFPGVALVLVSAIAARAATFVVNTTAPSGPGSLFQAITDANATPGPDLIVFNLPSYPATITPTGPLPDILDSVVIDGTVSANCLTTYAPQIELNGSAAGVNVNGLTANGSASPLTVTIKGLAIHNYSAAGILLLRNTNSVIQGNYLGTDLTGLVSLPNARGLVIDTCTNVVVGGIQPCERNVASGNLGDGLVVLNGQSHRVIGNYVGLTANGKWPLGNGVGVTLVSCVNCQIGSLLPGEGNVISRNSQAGVQVNGALGVPMQTRIEGNFIGTLPDGAFPAGNGGEGVFFFGGPTSNTVRGNITAWNGAQGVSVLAGTDNTIVENSIFNNGGLGIDISPVGTSNPNDACDSDTGPNRKQNYPIITTALNFGGSLQLDGFLESEPALPFRVDFYWNPACDSSGSGEGEHYIGKITVGPGSAGVCVNNFSVNFPVAVPAGSVITATATHPGGSTSEFSPCLPVSIVASNVVNHAGFPHTPVGNATLSEANGWLDVSGINATGSNGVSIALGRAQGWQASLDSLQLLVGDRLQTKVMNDAGSNSTLLASAVLSATANGLKFGGNFYFTGSNTVQSLRLELRDDNNQLVSSIPFPNGGEYTLPTCTNGQNYVVCSNAYVSLHSGEPAFWWKLCQVVCIPPGPYPGAPVFAPVRLFCLVAEAPFRYTNDCILCPKVDTGTNQFAGTIVLTGTSASPPVGGAHMRVGTEWLQQFDQLHQSLQNVTLNGWQHPGGVNVPATAYSGGIPGGGCIRSELDSARYVGVVAKLLPLPQSTAIWSILVGTNQISDSINIQANQNGTTIGFGYAASGSSTGRLDFFFHGHPVGSMNAMTGTVINAGSVPLRVAASTSPFTPAATRGFALYWVDPVAILVGNQGQPIQADELRLSPLNPSTPLPWMTRLDIECSGVSGFEILGDSTRPAVPGPLTLRRAGNVLLLSYPNEPERPYRIDFSDSLTPNSWQPFDTFLGDGSVRQLQISPALPKRFYRLSGM